MVFYRYDFLSVTISIQILGGDWLHIPTTMADSQTSRSLDMGLLRGVVDEGFDRRKAPSQCRNMSMQGPSAPPAGCSKLHGSW